MGMDGSTDIQLSQKLFQNRTEDLPSGEAKVSSASSVTNSHINGASEYHSKQILSIVLMCFLVAGLVTLQNLQNLASLQQSLPQVASLAVGLQNMSNLQGSSVVNTPLNLSVGSSSGKRINAF